MFNVVISGEVYLRFICISSLGTNYAKSDFSNVVTKNLSKNGYYKLPDGLMFQWGINTSSAQHRTVYLPISFFDSDYSVTITPQSPTNINVLTVFSTNSYGKSSFIATGAFRGIDSSFGYPSEPFRWIAIGRWK